MNTSIYTDFEKQDRLWTPDDVAAFLRVTKRQVSERYSKRHDFPRCVRLPSDRGGGHMRWFPEEIIQWAQKRQNDA